MTMCFDLRELHLDAANASSNCTLWLKYRLTTAMMTFAVNEKKMLKIDEACLSLPLLFCLSDIA